MFYKKSDVAILLVVIIVAAAAIVAYNHFAKQLPVKAEIYHNGTLVKTVDLTLGIDEIFSVPEVPQVEFHLHPDGKINFEKSDCPDRICIKSGKLGRAGQSAACLPNGLVLKIVPSGREQKDDVDIVIGH